MSSQNQKTSEIVKVMNRRPKKQIKPSMVMSSTGWEPCVSFGTGGSVSQSVEHEKSAFSVRNVQEGDSRMGEQKHQ